MAAASPLDAFAHFLLMAHMVQHLVLTMLAAPLVLLGSPMLPLLRGLPKSWVRDGLGPFLAAPALRRTGRLLTHPLVCYAAFAAATLGWHLPTAYELALRSETWHQIEHACFFFGAILFWWPVILPFPARPHWPGWSRIPYLLAADILNTAIGAFFSFYESTLYPTYASAPRITHLSALQDQSGAGALMWVIGSIGYLVPAGIIAIMTFSPQRLVRPSEYFRVLARVSPSQSRSQPTLATPTRHTLAVASPPAATAWLHTAAKWRPFAQVALLITAIAVILDGFFGPQVAAMNLAGTLPWTYWRGFAVIALLTIGNLFCFACPFVFVRDLGRKLVPASLRRHWPRVLRNKGPAIALLIVYLWAYEAFALWNNPWMTACMILGYFAAAFTIDTLFRGAPFCQYICPIGQYHFVQSLVSPAVIKVRELDTCRTCRTHDCIRGNEDARGCELRLFQPRKLGNMDCTLCLDCVAACPHQNIELAPASPVADLVPRLRSSAKDDRHTRKATGPLAYRSRRADVAILAAVLVAGAFANAAGMVAPVQDFLADATRSVSFASPVPAITLFLVAALLVIPFTAIAACVWLSRSALSPSFRMLPFGCSMVTALAPVGIAMWAAHFIFHLATGWHTAWPSFQRAALDLGISFLGTPDWSAPPIGPFQANLPWIEILLLDLGLLASLYGLWRHAQTYSLPHRAFRLFSPWASFATLLYLLGIWLIFQPMQMRGVSF